MRLLPGTRSSWPHAESHEEEFVYVVSGEVDAFSSDTLRILLAAGNGHPDQRLDLTDLTFIDHTGLLVLHQHARAVREQDLEFEIVGGPPSLRRLADLMGVTL